VLKKYSFLISLLSFLIFIGSLRSPLLAQSSLKSFFEQGKQKKSVVFVEDTTFVDPFMNQEVHIRNFNEIWWENTSTVYILQHKTSTIKVEGITKDDGQSVLCKYTSEKAIPYLDQQLKEIKASMRSRFQTTSNRRSFDAQNCVIKHSIQPLNSKTPVIRRMLSGDFVIRSTPFKVLRTLKEPPEAKLMRSRNGKLVLDLGIQMPYHYKFGNVLEQETELIEVSNEKGITIYPPSTTPEWRKQLITTGNFAQGLYSQKDKANPYSTKKNFVTARILDDQRFNALFYLDSDLTDIGSTLTVKGNLYVKGYGDELSSNMMEGWNFKTKKVIVGEMEQVKMYLHDNQVTNIARDSDWKVLHLIDKNGQTKYTINRGEWKIVYIKPEDEIVKIEVVSRTPQIFKIPIDLTLSTNDLNQVKSKIDQPIFTDFSVYSPNSNQGFSGLAANFKLPLKEGEMIQSINNLMVTDGITKNLSDPTNKRGISFIKDRRSDFANCYTIQVKTLTPPSKDAETIQIAAEISIKGGTGNTRALPFEEEISISKKGNPSNTKMSYSLENSMKPVKLEVHSDYNLFLHGIKATYQLKQQGEKLIYAIDPLKSKILSFKDEGEHDLIAAHQNLYESRYDQEKRLIHLSEAQQAINFPPSFTSNRNQFSIKLYHLPQYPAQKAFGTLDLSYSVYNPEITKKHQETIEYSKQNTIVLQLDKTHFHLIKSPSSKRGKDGVYDQYYLNNVNVPIKKVYLKDNTGKVVWEKEYSKNKADRLLFPQSAKGKLTVEFEYYPLEYLQEKVNVEMSLDF